MRKNKDKIYIAIYVFIYKHIDQKRINTKTHKNEGIRENDE